MFQLGRTLARRGPYHFLVRNWEAIADPNHLARAIEAEYFRDVLEPVPLDLPPGRPVLVLAPHADDEVIGAGGTLSLAARRRVPIHIAYVTDGELHDVPDSVSIRSAEADRVCAALGAEKHDLGISNTTCDVTVEHVRRLRALVERIRPATIMLPWLFDAPAKHRMVNHLVWLAHLVRPLPHCQIWGYQVHNVLFPNGYVDVTEVAHQKRRLIAEYTSQNVRLYRYDHLAMGMAAWNTRFLGERVKGDGIARYVEVFFAVPCKAFCELVVRHYLSDLGATYRGNARIIRSLTRLHRALIGAGPAPADAVP